jgi:hypothetical protein
VFQGAIPSSQKKTNHNIRYESEETSKTTKDRQGKLTPPSSSTLPGAVAAGIQLEKMHLVQG